MTNVAAWDRREMVAWPDCRYCGAFGDELNPLEFDEDDALALDLRNYDAPVTRTTSLTLDGSRKSEVGLDLVAPGAGHVAAGSSFEQETSISCTTSYTFPAGHWFVPYRLRGDRAALPFWAAR